MYDIAPEVLRHRIVLSYEALADGVEADHLVTRIITAIQLPRIAPSQERVPGSRPPGLTGGDLPVAGTVPDERTA